MGARQRPDVAVIDYRGIAAEAALDLAEALGTSPRLWMNLQATYDLSEAARKRRAA